MTSTPDPHAWDPQPAKFEPAPLPTQSTLWLAPSQSIVDIVNAIAKAENERLEMVLMEALADPRRPGIAVIEHDLIISLDQMDRYEDPRYVAEQRTEIRLDTNVPDAHIFRFPSQGSYDAWVESGCPVERDR